MNVSMQKPEPVTVARQSGMTLIELTVVLLVLIGLAGMLLPYVGGFAERTHDSANTSSEAELASAIGRYEAQYMEFPNFMDSLITGAAAPGAIMNYSIADRMGGTNSFAVTYGAAIRNLTGAATPMCGSLRKAGITQLKRMDAAVNPVLTPVTGTTLGTAFNPTFNYYVTPNWDLGTAGACAGSVVELTDNQTIANTVGWPLTQVEAKRQQGHTFVAVGMGTASEAIGRTIQDAPVHFAARGDVNAANAYNRLLVIFEVDGNAAATVNGGPCSIGTHAQYASTGCTAAQAATGGADSPRTAANAYRATLAGTGMAMHMMLGKNSSISGFYTRMQQ